MTEEKKPEDTPEVSTDLGEDLNDGWYKRKKADLDVNAIMEEEDKKRKAGIMETLKTKYSTWQEERARSERFKQEDRARKAEAKIEKMEKEAKVRDIERRSKELETKLRTEQNTSLNKIKETLAPYARGANNAAASAARAWERKPDMPVNRMRSPRRAYRAQTQQVRTVQSPQKERKNAIMTQITHDRPGANPGLGSGLFSGPKSEPKGSPPLLFRQSSGGGNAAGGGLGLGGALYREFNKPKGRK